MKNTTRTQVWQNPLHFIAFGFGSGSVPFAPGTFGTLMAVPFYLLLASLPLLAYLVILFLFIVLSCVLCDKVSRDLQVHDHPGIVIDEFAGFFTTMIAAPHGVWWVGLGVLLFRFFDILKPWPIQWIDTKVKGGFGIVIDDVVAGLFSFCFMQICKYLVL